MIELTYKRAKEIKNSIVMFLGCHEPLQAATGSYVEPTKIPRDSLPSTIICLKKAKLGQENNKCAAVDGSHCPNGYSIEALQKLAT